MSNEPKPALQPMAAAHDDRDAAARRRDTAGYRMSQAGLIEAGVDAASEDSSDEYSSSSGYGVRPCLMCMQGSLSATALQ